MTDRLGTALAAISDPTPAGDHRPAGARPGRVTDVATPFPVSLNTVSKHVEVLERARLVRRARSGREHVLTLSAEPLRLVIRWVLRYERF